jgi:hypothetical protein
VIRPAYATKQLFCFARKHRPAGHRQLTRHAYG